MPTKLSRQELAMNPFPLLTALLVLAGSAAPLQAVPADRDAVLDRHALQAPKEVEGKAASLAKYLVKRAKTDREKVRAIYRWITDRITYDVESFLTLQPGDNSIPAVLKSRKAVCEGFTNLFRDLCKKTGLEAVTVVGWAKGSLYQPGKRSEANNHAWNAVKLGGKWHLLDVAWGAGVIKGKEFEKVFNPFYFLTPPDQLIFTHFPTKAKWQLLQPAVSEKEFEKLPKVSPYLFRLGITGSAIRKELAKNGGSLVKAFKHPGLNTTVREAPLGLHLRAGTRYRFRFESADYESMAVHSAGGWTFLKRKGKVFEGVVAAPREGKVTVRGKPRGQKAKTFWGILQYVVD
jgi:hypothetical protein